MPTTSSSSSSSSSASDSSDWSDDASASEANGRRANETNVHATVRIVRANARARAREHRATLKLANEDLASARSRAEDDERIARARAEANEASTSDGEGGDGDDDVASASRDDGCANDDFVGGFLGALHDDACAEVLKRLTPREAARAACVSKKAKAMLTTSAVATEVWRRVALSDDDDASKALATLRALARTTLRELDVSGANVRGLRRGDFIETLRTCEGVVEARACDLGEVGKLSTKDVFACFEAAGTRLRRLTCDLGHKIVYDPIRRDPTAKYIDVYDDNVAELARALGNDALRVRRLKLHSADPGSVRAAAVASAGNGADKVQSFDASWSLRISDEGARAVAECLAQGWDVKRLRIAKAAVTDDGAAAIAAAVVQAGADGKSRLRWLDLGCNDIRGLGASAIGDAVGSPGVCITRLTLRGNGIQFDGLRAIGRGCANSSTLRRIDLAHNGFGDSGILALAEGFSRANIANLRVLVLGFNSIGPDGVRGLMRSLVNTDVEHLDLTCNVVGSDGAEEIAKVLNTTKLKILNLAVNNIGVRGARAGVRSLAKALEDNQTLEHLNLRGNAISRSCAGDLADMLLEDTALIQLNVGYNELYDHGAWEIAEALEDNTNLLGIDLQRNEITDEGAVFLAKTLDVNSVLEDVDLRSNMISPEGQKRFQLFGDRVNCRWQLEPPKTVAKLRRGA